LAIDGFLIWRATLPLTSPRPMRRRKWAKLPLTRWAVSWFLL